MPYADPEKNRQCIKLWRETHKEELTEYRRGRSKELAKLRMKYCENNPAKRLLWAAKKRAKEKGLEFNLTEKDIVIPLVCPYLGIPLVSHRERGDSRRDIASLDRIDNTKGYTRGNIEVISWLANTMKNNADPELLVRFASEVLKRYSKT